MKSSVSGGTSSFFVTGGTLGHDAPSYVERPADRQLYEALLQGEFSYVLTSRQMGKSSLMVHTAQRLREQGVQVIVLDLTAIGRNLTPEQWYDGLMIRMGHQLGLESEFEEFWNSAHHLSPVQRLFTAIEKMALGRTSGPLVIFVDEIDIVRSLPFPTDEFFAAVRECYNRRSQEPLWKRVSFCLLGVATPSDLIRETRMTPFNLGRRIELNDFSETDAQPLVQGLERPGRAGQALLRRILYWTGGHPYLTQRLCQAVTQAGEGEVNVDRICDELFFAERAREKDDNLIFVRERLLRSETDIAGLLITYGQVVTWYRRVPDDETRPHISLLRLSGIVRSHDGRLDVRNRIYARAFDRAWVKAHMPDAERRRARKAFIKGLCFATAGGAAIVIIMIWLLVYALEKHDRARDATWEALRAQARATHLSLQAGRRFDALKAITAAAHIKSSPELVDEAIACLSGPDLRLDLSWRAPLPNAHHALAFSPNLYAWSDSRGRISVVALSNNEERWTLTGTGQAAERIWLSPNETHLATLTAAQGNEILSVYKLDGSEPLWRLTNEVHLLAFAFNEEATRLVLSSSDNSISTHDATGGKLLRQWEEDMPCNSIAWRPGTSQFAAASGERHIVKIFEADAEPRIIYPSCAIVRLAWDSKGALLAAAGNNRRVYLWKANHNYEQEELDRQAGEIVALHFNHAGNVLASASQDGTVCLWDPVRARLAVTLPGGPEIRELVFSHDDRYLYSRIFENQLQRWEVAPEPSLALEMRAHQITQVDFHPDGRWLVAAHESGVSIWDLPQHSIAAELEVGSTLTTRFQPRTGNLINAEFGGVHCYVSHEPAQGNLILRDDSNFHLPPGVSALDFNGDGQVMAALRDTRVEIWGMEKTKHVRLAQLDSPNRLTGLALSPDAQWVAAGNMLTAELMIWDVRSSNIVARFPVKGQLTLAFSGDGRWLGYGAEKECGLINVGAWTITQRTERRPPNNRSGLVGFSADGRLWAATVSDSAIELHDLKTATRLGRLEMADRGSLVSLRFSADGAQLACASGPEGSVTIWYLDELSTSLAAIGIEWPKELFASAASPPVHPAAVLVQLGEVKESTDLQELRLLRRAEELTFFIDHGSTNASRYEQRAEVLEDLGRHAEAARDFLECAQRDPENKKALSRLIRLYLFGPGEVRRYEAVLPWAVKAVELNGNDSLTHAWLGVARYRNGQYAEALSTFSRARELTGTNSHPLVLFYEAMCYAKLDQKSHAQHSFEQAVQATHKPAHSPEDQWRDLATEVAKEVGP